MPTRNENVAAWAVPTVRPRRELIGACMPTRQPAATPSSTARPRLIARDRSRRRLPLTSPPATCGRARRRPPSGGWRSHTPHISRSISSRACSASSGGPSNSSSSWIVSSSRVLQRRVGQRAVAADHRELDDVRGGALDDRVHREALAERARLVVARAQLGDLAAAPPQRRHVAPPRAPARSVSAMKRATCGKRSR